MNQLRLLALPVAMLILGCEAGAGPAAPGAAAPSTSAQAYVAAGRATDAAGAPLADVTVDVDGKTANLGGIVSFDPKTGADGRYRQPDLPPGTYSARAWRSLSYNGHRYTLPLKPTDGEVNKSFQSSDGIVRDFVWQIQGPVPGAVDPEQAGSFYGGSVEVHGTDGLYNELELPEGTTLEATLTPDGPLMDGSAGETLRREFPYRKGLYWKELVDIPLGRYKMTLQALPPGGAAMTVRMTPPGKGGYQDDHFQAEIPVEFLPANSATRPYQFGATAQQDTYVKL